MDDLDGIPLVNFIIVGGYKFGELAALVFYIVYTLPLIMHSKDLFLKYTVEEYLIDVIIIPAIKVVAWPVVVLLWIYNFIFKRGG